MFILETRTNQKLKEALNSCIEINTIFYFLLLFFKFLLMIIWFAWNLEAKWILNDNTSTSIMASYQCLKGIHQSKPHLNASKIMLLMGHSMWYSHLKKRFSIWLLKVWDRGIGNFRVFLEGRAWRLMLEIWYSRNIAKKEEDDEELVTTSCEDDYRSEKKTDVN